MLLLILLKRRQTIPNTNLVSMSGIWLEFILGLLRVVGDLVSFMVFRKCFLIEGKVLSYVF